MSKYPSDVIKVAKSQIGYLEKASNSQLDSFTANPGNKNFTKYARDMDTVPWFNGSKQGAEWCTTFVNWCFWRAYGMEGKNMLCEPQNRRVNYAAGCIWAVKYYKEVKRYFETNPKVGDQIFFGKDGDEDHTGLLIQVTKDEIKCIEGNSLNSVRLTSYKKTDSWIAGFGRPLYEGEDPYIVNVVAAGDTLNAIADEYMSSVAVICQDNNITNPNIIRVNEVLIVKKNIRKEPAIYQVKDAVLALQCALDVSYSNEWDSKTEAHVAARALKKGSTGGLVKLFQTLLCLNDFPVQIDGDFGAKTETQLKAFQKAHYLTVDGIAGPETWRKIVG